MPQPPDFSESPDYRKRETPPVDHPILQEIERRLSEAWIDWGPPRTDWLGLEVLLRDSLSSRLPDGVKVSLCREAIAAWTRRG